MRKIVLGALALTLLTSLEVGAQSAVDSGKELFGDMAARHIGPAVMSGRINDMELHPTNSRIIYTGTAGGGVWKSSDGARTFSPIFDEHCQSIGAVSIDPNDPDNTIYVGTGETWTRNSVSIGDGLYKSTDGGANWKNIGLEKSERIGNIIVNPKNSKEIYVGVLGALWGDSEERGVYKSNDGGETWNKLLYINEGTGCADLAIDPTNPNILYAAMWEFRRTAWSFNSGGPNSALYKSTDAGATWNKIHNGFPEGKLGRLAIAVAPSNPNVLYTAIEAEQKERKGLYRSDDAGETWKQLNNDFGITVRPFYFSRIVVDPNDENIVVKGGLNGSISRDGGKTFKNLGYMHSDIHDIAFSINDSDIMYFGTDGGVYRSWDGGSTTEIVQDLPLSQFYHISTDDAEPYNVYGGLQDNGSWYGPSTSRNGVSAADWKNVGGGDGFRVLKHPTKNIVYSEVYNGEIVWRYDLDKNLIKTIQPLQTEKTAKLRFNWNTPIAVSDANPDRFYIASQFIHRSEDMGDTWEIISPDLTTDDDTKYGKDSGGLSVDNSGAENYSTIFTIAESPLDENVIWAGTDDGNVQVTQDGGKTWTNTVSNIEGLPANTWCYHIEASTFDKGTAYAVFDRHAAGDMKPYAYKTNDFGKTWTNIITDDVVGFARNIQEDYVNPDLLFLGTEFGLYITLDGGKKWKQFTNNMPSVAVHFIDLQKQTNDLVMGTHGRGVIIIDDISPLREINDNVLSKDLHFFDMAPVVIDETDSFSARFGTETEFVGNPKSKMAQFVYHLKKRHTFGKMSMEVQDMEGNLIQELGPGKSKGINIVRWNLRGSAPKTAKTDIALRYIASAPLVLEGTYKVVIKKGKETYEQTFEVVHDKNSPLSAEEHAFRYNTIKKINAITEELAYLVYELDEMITSAENEGNTKMEAKLNDFKKTLVITTGDAYTGAAEPELKEKILTLNSKVNGNYDVPSSTDLNNLELLTDQFTKAKEDFAKLKKKFKSKTPIAPMSFEEFVKS
ncbi:hypothetical protein FGM00_08180 [Aggregatimonas sangjinii]|uniref:Sortilin N-terminal domain-containing protein n=1 Tax=Aggregatimonas sangjinii TaxID=2583587 RepID=A0A5B7SSX5_9FLAO|nr:hypothetical protein [Aggregatimonas sangjinii]QCX00081.1 hypothetical protein FGM00_08180 [Aggregatimonas sangjinii]